MYNPACASAGIPARTSPPASHTRLRNGCRYHVYGRCQARPRRREQVRLQGHPRLRGRAQEGGRRPRHPPGTNTAMRPPAPAPATDASLETIARARARPRAPLDRIARASHDVVVASTTRARGDTGSRDSSKTRAIAPIQGPARRVRRGYAPGSPRARAEASAGFRRRSPRRAPRSAWRATRASDARPRARDPAHVRAPGALRAHPPALYPLAAVWRASWHSDPARSNPGFLSHEPGRRKSEKRFVLSPVFFSEVFSSRVSST